MTGTIIGVVAIVAVFGGLLFVMPKLVQPTVPFGVHVPDTHVAAPAVLQATRRYQRDLIGTMISVVAVLAALAVFVPACERRYYGGVDSAAYGSTWASNSRRSRERTWGRTFPCR